MKQEIKKILQEAIDEMAGFARVRNIMQGAVAGIDSIGIMTAENPHGKQASKEYNQEAMAKLKSKLRSMGYGFHRIKGRYGVDENSLFIPNINQEELIGLGREFEQDSVSFGQKYLDDDGYHIEWNYIEEGDVLQTRNISYSTSNIQNKEDFFSAIKNRKFIIPFFDEEHENAKQQRIPKNSVFAQR